MQNFHISEEYIELNRLLKVLNLAESGGQANQLIADGLVQVNGNLETQKRKKLRPGDIVQFNKTEIQILNDEGE